MTHRRQFLKSALAGTTAISLSGRMPKFLSGASKLESCGSGNILVVIQMSGGNDGLNTVIPYGDDEYYKNRFTLSFNKNQVLKIDDHVGFHPALSGFDQLLQANQIAIIQGVGYEHPNRSHFESMDLWNTAHRTDEKSNYGWLGRTVENHFLKEDLAAIHLGKGLQPLALKTVTRPVPSIRSIDNFKLQSIKGDRNIEALTKAVETHRPSNNHLLDYIQNSAQIALSTSQRIEGLKKRPSNPTGYPATDLGTNLRVIADLIESDLPTRIYYVTLNGFDTHSNQAATHQNLLNDLGNSISAFMKQLELGKNADRVAIFSFSEFGRRVRENASRGTDHGTAAPVFVCGQKVNGGVIGTPPNLVDLDQGDLKYQIDYRRVYSDLLKNWLGVAPSEILDGQFESLDLFS